MKDIWVNTNQEINLNELAADISRNLNDEDIRNFILLLDEKLEDEDFSITLINDLIKSLHFSEEQFKDIIYNSFKESEE